MTTIAIIYLIGVVTGLAVMRDRWLVRLATALAWPLGPLAGALVISSMLVFALFLWPLPMLAVTTIVTLLIYAVAC